MSSFWHRVGVYFGLAEQTPEERAAAQERPPVSLARRVVGALAGLTAVGLVAGLIDQSVSNGVRFALVFGASMAAIRIYDHLKHARQREGPAE